MIVCLRTARTRVGSSKCRGYGQRFQANGSTAVSTRRNIVSEPESVASFNEVYKGLDVLQSSFDKERIVPRVSAGELIFIPPPQGLHEYSFWIALIHLFLFPAVRPHIHI